MKKAAGLEAHIRQVVADYEWLLELAQERLDQYVRLTGAREDGPAYEVRTIEDGFVYGERAYRGEIETLSIPLEYLWIADMAGAIEKARTVHAALETAQREAREEQAAQEKAARDQRSWLHLVTEYGPGGPP